MVRLLLSRDGSVLTVPRADGAGPDLPNAAVGEETPDEALAGLAQRVLGRHAPARLLGYVRNTVPDPTPHYPWPVPVAHFTVWQCVAPQGVEPDGRWLDEASARTLLAERHWWPLHPRRDG
ncbi:NUDIX hydrolase [Phycicoccus avicenniae]|uniref:NUDIX hydrolase n=1 Tax=Phycicoccus avicenniae TaxID=2828860 RepID=UPI003D265A71